jgi:hypothetical protein
MPGAHILDGLMKWAQREEWRDAFADLLDRHLGPACSSVGVDVEDLPSLIGEHWSTTLWGCAFEDFLARELADGRNIVDEYLKRRGWKESASNRAYMKALRSSVMSLYEVSDVVSGESFLARDLVRGGDPVRVSEKSATRTLRQWDRIGARVMHTGDKTVIGGLLTFDHHEGEEVLAALRRARKTARKETAEVSRSLGLEIDAGTIDGPFTEETVLANSAFLFSDIFLRKALARILNPQVPQVVNSDGDPLQFVTLRYPLLPGTTPRAVRAALRSLPALRKENDHFWNWVDKEGPKKPLGKAPGVQTFITTMDDGSVVLGNVELKGKVLELSANSPSRAERGRALLDPALKGLVGDPLVETESVEQMLASPRAKGAEKLPLHLPPDEERAIVHQALDEHYGRLLDEPIAMLGNKSPITAAKTAKGREKVVAWLKLLENHSARQPEDNPMRDYDFTWLWERLGLADQRR